MESDPAASDPDSGSTVVSCGGTEIYTGDLVIASELFTMEITDDGSGVETEGNYD